MSTDKQRSRLVRLRQKVRTDLWPNAPKIDESLSRRFPELAVFNDRMAEWVERLRNTTEPEADVPTASTTGTETVVQRVTEVGPQGPRGPQGPQGLGVGSFPPLPPGDEVTYATMAKYGGF